MGVARHVRAIAPLPGVAGVLVPAPIVTGEGTNIGSRLGGAGAAIPVVVAIRRARRR